MIRPRGIQLGEFAQDLRTFAAFRRRPLHTLAELARVEQPVTKIRLFIETLYYAHSPEAIRHVLVDRRDRYARANNLEAPWLAPLLGKGLLTVDGDAWLRLRRATQPGFRQVGVAALAERVARTIERALDTWPSWSGSMDEVDVFPELVALTTAAAMSAFLDADLAWAEARDMADAMLDGQVHILRHIRNPLWPPDWVPLPVNRRYVAGTRFLADRIVRAADERRRRPPRDGVTDLFAVLTSSDRVMSAELRDQFVTDVLAAPENTATTLTWLLYLLERHPAVQAAVRDEITSVLGDRRPTAEDIARLGVLRCALDETLRLYPGAPYYDRRALVDDVVCGVAVPRGSIVMIAPYVLHRSAAFWSDPEAFRPERFAPGGEGVGNAAYQPFGAGPRRCIGEHFALLVIQLALPMLLQRLHFTRRARTEVEVDPQINLRPRRGMWMHLARRSSRQHGERHRSRAVAV